MKIDKFQIPNSKLPQKKSEAFFQSNLEFGI